MEQTEQLMKHYLSKEQVINHLVENNDATYNISKLEEELVELLEVLVKHRNKVERYKPPIDKFIEEIGDVEVRMEIVKRMLQITEGVETRKTYKLGRLGGSITLGKYGNKI